MTTFKQGQRAIWGGDTVTVESGPHAKAGTGGKWYLVKYVASGSVSLANAVTISPVPPRRGDRGAIDANQSVAFYTIYMIDKKYVILESIHGVATVWDRDQFDTIWLPA